MNDVAPFRDLIEEIASNDAITADDVRLLRQQVFVDGVVQRREAEAVFHLDRTCASKDAAWLEFYVDALTDYFVWQAQPSRRVDAEKADFLTANILCDGRVVSASALELLINIIHWAEACPKELTLLALEAVRDSVLDFDYAVYGAGRRPGAIDAVDVEVIRRVIYAPAGDGGYLVTRREAELLFALERSTNPIRNDKSWSDLFVRGVANHLMFPRGLPLQPDAQEVSRRDAWLRERRGVGLLLMDVGHAFGSFDFAGAWDELDLFGTRRARDDAASEAAEATAARIRAAVDESEAFWLLDQIAQLDHDSDNVAALLRFTARHATSVHPRLQPLLGLSAA
ncbi:MAG: hypothetical protein ACFCUQ_17800 [Kiloniellales bacterium]